MHVKTSLREALNDDRLLGKALPGDSWHVWRVVLLATMGEPLTDDELETYRNVTGGRTVSPTEPVDEFIGVIGRRGGKSHAEAVLASYLSTLVDFSDVLSAGEQPVFLCIAPDIRQAGVSAGYIAGTLAESPILGPLVESTTRTAIRLHNGVTIETRASNFRRLRGATLIGCIADECAFWMSDETSSNPDAAILEAVRPALATTGGPLILISTPYSRRGELWRMHSQHFGPQSDPRILAVHGPSRVFNPALPASVVERALERDRAWAEAEYLAQFRSDIAAFISREAVLDCVDHDVRERPYISGIRYYAHVDPSGGSNDSFALAIAHREGDRAILDLVREVKPPFSPEGVTAEFCETLKAYRIKTVTGDRYAGEWPREQFRKHGVIYKVADKTASQLFGELLPMINGGTARLLDHKRLIHQLVNLERRTSFGSGRDTIGHPMGAHYHDDVAVSVAGALLSATSRRRELRVGTYGSDAARQHKGAWLYRDGDGRLWLKSEPEYPNPHVGGVRGCY